MRTTLRGASSGKTLGCCQRYQRRRKTNALGCWGSCEKVPLATKAGLWSWGLRISRVSGWPVLRFRETGRDGIGWGLSRFQARHFFRHYDAGALHWSRPQVPCGALTHDPEITLYGLSLPGTSSSALNGKGGGWSKVGRQGPSPAEQEQRPWTLWGRAVLHPWIDCCHYQIFLTVTFWFIRFISLTFRTLQKE